MGLAHIIALAILLLAAFGLFAVVAAPQEMRNPRRFFWFGRPNRNAEKGEDLDVLRASRALRNARRNSLAPRLKDTPPVSRSDEHDGDDDEEFQLFDSRDEVDRTEHWSAPVDPEAVTQGTGTLEVPDSNSTSQNVDESPADAVNSVAVVGEGAAQDDVENEVEGEVEPAAEDEFDPFEEPRVDDQLDEEDEIDDIEQHLDTTGEVESQQPKTDEIAEVHVTGEHLQAQGAELLEQQEVIASPAGAAEPEIETQTKQPSPPAAVIEVEHDELPPLLVEELPEPPEGRNGRRVIWPRLLQIDPASVDQYERVSILRTVGVIADDIAGPVLCEALEQEDVAEVRDAALEAVRDAGILDAVDELRESLTSSRDRERLLAVEALAAIGATQEVHRALSDANMAVVAAASKVLRIREHDDKHTATGGSAMHEPVTA